MTKPIPDGYHSLNVITTLKDCRRAIAFYERAFGARQTFLMERPDGGGVVHATIAIGDSTLMMGDEMPGAPCRSAETIGESPVSFYLYVPDVDALFDQAVAAGATVRTPVTDMFWGDRMGTVIDPFGHAWTLASHVNDPSAEEMAKGAQAAYQHAS